MRRVLEVRASDLRRGDVVALDLVSVVVQAVLKGRGRVDVITAGGLPVTLSASDVVRVLRGGFPS